MGLEQPIEHYATNAVDYVRAIRDNPHLTAYEKVLSFKNIASTPITKTKSFQSLDDVSKRIWLVVSRMMTTEYISVYIDAVPEYEQCNILHETLVSVINSYEVIRHSYGERIPQPTTELFPILKKLTEKHKEMYERMHLMIDFPYALYRNYPMLVDYIIDNMPFDWYCINHRLINSVIKDVDIDTSLWENKYIRIVNKVKLVNNTDSVAHRIILHD